jgi:phytoene dehydrogenase-like protein
VGRGRQRPKAVNGWGWYRMTRVVVVGAGLAGLSAALALAVRRHAVTILEAGAEAGGHARRVEAAGARVDVGPTVLVDLDPLRALFALAGARLEDALPLVRLDPGLLATFAGGKSAGSGARLAFHADPARVLAELAALGPRAVADWQRLLDLGARADRLAAHYYARGDVTGPRDLAGFVAGGDVRLRELIPFARHGSLARLLEAQVATPELRALLAHFARFLGLDAGQAPAVTLVIPYLLATRGVFYPVGGVSAVAEAVLRLAAKHGAVLETGERAVGLDLADGRLRAVRTASGRRLEADGCVAAVDAGVTASWLPAAPLAARVARLAPTLAARVAWWVVEGRSPQEVHHRLHFGATSAEPLYVATPTASDPTLAPPGTSVIYALLHGPPGEAASGAFGERLREAVVEAGQWPGGRVLAHGVAGGAGACYGYAIGPGLFASFRLPQRVRGVAGLVLAGGSVFPGPGVANVVRSGLRAAALLDATPGAWEHAAPRPPLEGQRPDRGDRGWGWGRSRT